MIDAPTGRDITDIKTSAFSELAVLVCSATATSLALGWLLWYSGYGIDFSDESFYLVWMANPFNYSVSATQFGFIYHPLYQLLDGNIAAIRRANILINFGLSWLLSDILLKAFLHRGSLQRLQRVIISGAVATTAATSLVYAGLWLPSPSYNSLALQALLITATGLLLTEKTGSRASTGGWILIGIGGWLAFMAKPTTAAVLGVSCAVYLIVAGKSSIRSLAFPIATAVGATVLSALVIDGSIIAFVDRLREGAEMYRILDAGHVKLFRVDDFYLNEGSKLVLFGFTAIVFLAAYFSQSTVKVLAHGAVMLSLLFAAACPVILFAVKKGLNTGPFQGLLICAVPFATILTVFLINGFDWILRIARTEWASALMFLTLPYVYAFGTNGNQWDSATACAIFWVLAGFAVLKPLASNRRLPSLLLIFALAAQAITMALVHSGTESPYRQPQPLRENDYKLEIGRPGSTLIVANGFGQYIAAALAVARRAGFERGTPMIDLTGRSPGILYALGASSIGQPWTVGAYPGSEALAMAMLKKVSCQDLASAWVLAEPDGPRKISPEILLSFGANMTTDFAVVGKFKTAEAQKEKQPHVQQLLQPIRPAAKAIAACTSGRSLKP